MDSARRVYLGQYPLPEDLVMRVVNPERVLMQQTLPVFHVKQVSSRLQVTLPVRVPTVQVERMQSKRVKPLAPLARRGRPTTKMVRPLKILAGHAMRARIKTNRGVAPVSHVKEEKPL